MNARDPIGGLICVISYDMLTRQIEVTSSDA